MPWAGALRGHIAGSDICDLALFTCSHTHTLAGPMCDDGDARPARQTVKLKRRTTTLDSAGYSRISGCNFTALEGYKYVFSGLT